MVGYFFTGCISTLGSFSMLTGRLGDKFFIAIKREEFNLHTLRSFGAHNNF
jgi:hypothetical protein